MEIIIDTGIRKKYNQGFERNKPVRKFIVHGTAGASSSKGLINWMLKGERARQYKRGVALFHYAIDLDGIITEIIDPEMWVHHSSSGKQDKETIGVELINPSRDNSAPYTEAQYESLLWLYDYLRRRYFPEMDTILSHNMQKKKYSVKGKPICPGAGFDWIKWFNLVSGEYNFSYTKEEMKGLVKI